MIKLRDLLEFSPIDILVKSADQKSYHAILTDLKEKEVYNMIIDIHNTENMSDFLKAVRLINRFVTRQQVATEIVSFPDSRAADERLQVSLSLHLI